MTSFSDATRPARPSWTASVPPDQSGRGVSPGKFASSDAYPAADNATSPAPELGTPFTRKQMLAVASRLGFDPAIADRLDDAALAEVIRVADGTERLRSATFDPDEDADDDSIVDAFAEHAEKRTRRAKSPAGRINAAELKQAWLASKKSHNGRKYSAAEFCGLTGPGRR